jgi:hypothetical protein
MCFPNKLLDCIAAGIPIVCLNSRTAGEFVVQNNFGVSVQGLENLDKVPWHDKTFWNKCRDYVREHRYEYTMEKQLTKTLTEIGIE